MRVSVVCQNYQEDRVIPRMARALSERNGWTLGVAPDPSADVVYLSGYFEALRLKWPEVPVAAYLTHREEEPPNNAKARLFDRIAQQADLRVVTCRLYAEMVSGYGPTVQAAAPLERERLVIPKRERHARPVVGFSGYTYVNHRKGEDLVQGLLDSKVGKAVEWRASGRGWRVPTKRYPWAKMPEFYQGLDVLVVPSRVEGIPMPPLEAMACGVSVVVPEHVGIIDELPQVKGIYRYEKGDLASLLEALQRAVEERSGVDREALRGATEPYSVERWCEDIRRGIESITMPVVGSGPVEETRYLRDIRGQKSKRGIYVVAFGEPSRRSAARLLKSIKRHMPDIPVALCAASPLGLEDLFIEQPDSDVGGRRAKLKAYELSPAEWESVLYLDADTELVAPIYRYFEWVEDGWEFVMCKDPHLMDTMHAFERRNNKAEMRHIQDEIKTLNTLQINGGVWCFGRNERVAAFFQRWQREWERYAQRDQGALIRALYADPLRILILGNQWNTFPKYEKGITTAGLMHYPGEARRWKGMLPGRIDSAEAWAVVDRQAIR